MEKRKEPRGRGRCCRNRGKARAAQTGRIRALSCGRARGGVMRPGQAWARLGRKLPGWMTNDNRESRESTISRPTANLDAPPRRTAQRIDRLWRCVRRLRQRGRMREADAEPRAFQCGDIAAVLSDVPRGVASAQASPPGPVRCYN
jgi:hypothetical protein